jgi:hypothetical protein
MTIEKSDQHCRSRQSVFSVFVPTRSPSKALRRPELDYRYPVQRPTNVLNKTNALDEWYVGKPIPRTHCQKSFNEKRRRKQKYAAIREQIWGDGIADT